ncbi:hypothetical protein BDW71DRAFT_212606 [Aspergillus fruticulosus]
MPLWNVSHTWRVDLPRRIPYDCEVNTRPMKSPSLKMRMAMIMTTVTRNGVIDANQSAQSRVLDLRDQFRHKGQVIVKLANIELTPDKPKSEGRAWRIEGQPNERICATAINYYDFENNTENTLSFRHRADAYYYPAVNYEQEEFQFLRAFGFESDLGNNDYEPIT